VTPETYCVNYIYAKKRDKRNRSLLHCGIQTFIPYLAIRLVGRSTGDPLRIIGMPVPCCMWEAALWLEGKGDMEEGPFAVSGPENVVPCVYDTQILLKRDWWFWYRFVPNLLQWSIRVPI